MFVLSLLLLLLLLLFYFKQRAAARLLELLCWNCCRPLLAVVMTCDRYIEVGVIFIFSGACINVVEGRELLEYLT